MLPAAGMLCCAGYLLFSSQHGQQARQFSS